MSVDEHTAKFLDLFGTLERHIRGISKAPSSEGFSRHLSGAQARSLLVRNYADDIRIFADLRNLLSHGNARYKNRYVASPSQAVLESLRKIVGLMTDPPLLIKHFAVSIKEFRPNDEIGCLCAELQDKDYSNAFVRLDGKLEILTPNTLVRWLGHSQSVGLSDLSTPVGKVLEFRETDQELQFVNRTTTCVEAMQRFGDIGNRQLAAIIATERGLAEESPMALVTAWDLGTITRVIL